MPKDEIFNDHSTPKSKLGEFLMVGVLDLQGDVREHCRALERCGVEARRVKTLDDLDGVAGLIIPGGESTTMGQLLQRYGLFEALKKRIESGMPVYGTCAGAILLAKTLVGREKAQNLKVMDISVERNAYGRQKESFETVLDVSFETGKSSRVSAIFIRAPKIVKIGREAHVLARWGKNPVLIRQGHLLASTFHPELTDDLGVHRYFIGMVTEKVTSPN